MITALVIGVVFGVMALVWGILKFAFGVAFSLVGFILKVFLPVGIVCAIIGGIFLFLF